MPEETKANQEVIDLAADAITHVLTVIKHNEKVRYHLGAGTETYAKLTAAAAALFHEPVEKVREHFIPGSAALHRS